MKRLLYFLMLIVFFIVPIVPFEACTGLKLTSLDGRSVHGRTFEFGIKVDTSVIVVPRGYSFISKTPIGEGMAYQAKYAAVGAVCFDNMLIMDGMNEKGLSVGSFYFPGYAVYTSVTQGNKKRALSPIDFPNWIVTQFGTIEEVKAALDNVVIVPVVEIGWGNTAPPFHYVVYDKEGRSLVIEPLEGKLVVNENPLGVVTNSPTFDWHMTYLRNFINLKAKNAPPLQVNGITLTPFGQGSGMVGLPGDFTPPSRFVRAAIFSITADSSATSDEAIFQAFHILNQFDIPVGVARDVVDGVVHSDYTLVTVIHDPNKLKYYFRTYEDQTIKMVDLNLFDKQAKQIKGAKTNGRQAYVDISNELKSISSEEK